MSSWDPLRLVFQSIHRQSGKNSCTWYRFLIMAGLGTPILSSLLLRSGWEAWELERSGIFGGGAALKCIGATSESSCPISPHQLAGLWCACAVGSPGVLAGLGARAGRDRRDWRVRAEG